MTSARGWAGLAGALLLTACGGGAPLLHPAHALPEGEVTFAAGTSGNIMLGDLADAESELSDAQTQSSGASGEAERRRFAQGALARFAVAPGVAPFVAGRVGLGRANEGGITYTARTLRIDARHAFEWPNVALSFGLVALGALPHVGDRPDEDVSESPGGALRSVDLVSARGYGFELPVLFGWRSDADVVKLWTGVRAGVERDHYDITLVESNEPWSANGSATRWWTGGLFGFSVGLSPIEVRAELDVAYQSAHGDLVTSEGELTADVGGVSLTPAMAISAKF